LLDSTSTVVHVGLINIIIIIINDQAFIIYRLAFVGEGLAVPLHTHERTHTPTSTHAHTHTHLHTYNYA